MVRTVMKYLEPVGGLTTGFSTLESCSAGLFLCPSLPHLAPLWTQYISQQQAFHITFPPCFTSPRQTLGLTCAIHSVQMRELFIWSDQCGNANQLFTHSQSLFGNCGERSTLSASLTTSRSGARGWAWAGFLRSHAVRRAARPGPAPKVKQSAAVIWMSTQSLRHKPGTTTGLGLESELSQQGSAYGWNWGGREEDPRGHLVPVPS